MSIEELDHTADVMLRVRAPTIEALFSEAARGMFQIMYGECDGDSRTVTFTLHAHDLEELVQEFLSELLYLSEVQEIVFCRCEVLVAGTSLTATVTGIPFNPEQHRGGREIKGISFSGLTIVKEHESYGMDVIFDV